MSRTTLDVASYTARPAAVGVAALFRQQAARAPEHAAFVIPGADGHAAERVTYGALAAMADAFAAGLRADGYAPGDRLLLLAPPNAALYALALAVLGEGMTLALVDGRAAPRRLYAALRAAAPRAVVGTRAVLRWWPLVGALRRAARYSVDGALPGVRPLDALRASHAAAASPAARPNGPAIAAFTSGSTGKPKVVVRTHAVLEAQHRALGSAFPAPADDVNLPGFPMAVLHNLCCGTTTVLPPADLRAAALADPARMLAVVRGCGVTSLSGAPALLRGLARQAVREGAPLRDVRHVVVGGGPVGRGLCASIARAFPNASGSVVYGATEAEPIATCTLGDVLASDGEGFLVGEPLVDLSLGSDGEILVRGPHVIGSGWHRTGDVGRLDDRGRLWLLGRTGAGATDVLPYAIEAEALAVDGVDEAGFVAHAGEPRGELALSVAGGADVDAVVRAVLRRLAATRFGAPPIRVLDALPTDARHASKVRHRDLARLLEGRAR